MPGTESTSSPFLFQGVHENEEYISFNIRMRYICLLAQRRAEKVPDDLNYCELPCIRQILTFRG